ncbi:MAG: type I methionyl aminopeptidase [Chloroflexota bacterium]|nr:type I methionyl aminopeptidase [Chloroflexota bacterium]MDE2909352.1 type I methionyl aminopeptidase [Chloroflexota bacterium]
MAPVLKTADELEIMRQAGRIVAIAHEEMRRAIKPGVATKLLDTIALTVLRDNGAEPCFLGYAPGDHPPFPATITASVNNELVHGIPSEKRVLQEGDVIGIDVACFFQGYVGDAAFTHPVGEISRSAQRLLKATETALEAAIQASVLGNRISDVAKATAKCAGRLGYSVAREYTGHGVGREMHEEPQVPNWWHSKRSKHQWTDYDLQVGMTYAIEPMLIAGRSDLVEQDDGWTVVTKDGSLTAHFEHTVAITEDGPRILTLP